MKSITASQYDRIRAALIAEKRRLPLFYSKKFRDVATAALVILREIAPLPKLEPVWAYQITIKGEYEGTTFDVEEAKLHKTQGAKIKKVPSIYQDSRIVPEVLQRAAFRASEALNKAQSIMKQV